MILAGPGSGKTTVITHRVEHMIRVQDIDPSSILVITFSRAAAREMRERFLLLTKRQRLPVTFGTFHAIFFHFLKCAYGYSAKQIASGQMQTRFIREYMRRLRLETSDEAELARNILTALGREKNGLAAADRALPCEPEVFRMISEAYGEFLRQNHCIDFDDMLVLTKELFEKRQDILRGWQERYRYLLIDEFQDINRIQYDIVRMLALPRNNLFIVGDDDQSIYRFRGSDPSIMLHFEEDFPDAEKILLAANYRSTPQIVRTAGTLISHNEKRFPKDIRAAASSGREPSVMCFASQREQNGFVIDEIRRLNRVAGVPFEEMAVLFRTNAQPYLLMHQMSGHNIPFVSKEHIPGLFSHWIAEDVNTYLRIAMGDVRRSGFLRVMNRPDRGLSRESLPGGNVSFEAWIDYYRAWGSITPEAGGRIETDADARISHLRKMRADLATLAGLRPYSAVNYIRKAMGYEKYLRQCAASRNMPETEFFSILDEIQEDARGFDSCAAWFAHQDEMREKWERGFAQKNAPEDAVRMSTLHAAKGLEFDTVFLIDVNENVIPDKKAVTADEIEEERRLFYVGMTRAKRRLYLLCSNQIRNKTMAPSRFLEECGYSLPLL